MKESPSEGLITIFGVNNENLHYVQKFFSKYNPIYLTPNDFEKSKRLMYIKLPDESNTKLENKVGKGNKNNNDYTFKGYFEEIDSDSNDDNNDQFLQIKNAFLNTGGNWIYIMVKKKHFDDIINQKSKHVLENNDVIFCMGGMYQNEIDTSEFITKKDELSSESHEIEPIIYKMPKIKNLINLSFEGKSFNLKFNEFVLGNYVADREKETKDNTLSSLELILIVALTIFLIIFIYKVAK